MPKTFVKLLCFITCLVCSCALSAQPRYHDLAKDTIITLRQFPRNQYLLDGKKLNLPVMQWFMTDYPAANDQMRSAVLANQLSITGYSVGSLFFLTGLFIWEDNRSLSDELLRLGGIGFGSGILFQVISQGYEKKAVRLYNRDVRLLNQEGGTANLGAGVAGRRMIVRLSF